MTADRLISCGIHVILTIYFFFCFCFSLVHRVAYRLACIAIIMMCIEISVVTYIVYYSISAIPNSPSPLAISASVFITRSGQVSAMVLFISTCLFLIRRFHYLNMLLEQLLSDEPLSDAYEFVNNTRTFVDDLKYINQNTHKRWTAVSSPNGRSFNVFTVQNRKQTKPNDKLNRTTVNLSQPKINAWITENNSIDNVNNDRINDAMYGFENENTIWDPEIDKLVMRLPLSKIRLVKCL